MFFSSKILFNEMSHGCPVYKRVRPERRQSRPCPLAPFWVSPGALGPWTLACTQHCPALAFCEATCRNPRPSQAPLFLFPTFPATPVGAVPQHLWAWCTGESSRACHTGRAHLPSHPQLQLGCPGFPAWPIDAVDSQTLSLSPVRRPRPRLPPTLTWTRDRHRAAELTLAGPQSSQRQAPGPWPPPGPT